MKTINETYPRAYYQLKCGHSWTTCRVDLDPSRVYEELSKELTAKKINGCTWVKSISYKNKGDHQEITVDYGNGNRCVYHVERFAI